MSTQEAVEQLNRIGSGDSESAHVEADRILTEFLKATHPEVAAAYERVEERAGFWYA